MDDKDRKILTEWLGEQYDPYEIRGWVYYDEGGYSHLSACDPEDGTEQTVEVRKPKIRTFASPDDFFAIKNRLVELGNWNEFEAYAYGIWLDDMNTASFTNWLIEPARFCQLAADFLKGRNDDRIF